MPPGFPFGQSIGNGIVSYDSQPRRHEPTYSDFLLADNSGGSFANPFDGPLPGVEILANGDRGISFDPDNPFDVERFTFSDEIDYRTADALIASASDGLSFSNSYYDSMSPSERLVYVPANNAFEYVGNALAGVAREIGSGLVDVINDPLGAAQSAFYGVMEVAEYVGDFFGAAFYDRGSAERFVAKTDAIIQAGSNKLARLSSAFGDGNSFGVGLELSPFVEFGVGVGVGLRGFSRLGNIAPSSINKYYNPSLHKADLAKQSGIPKYIDLSNPSNVYGLDSQQLKTYFELNGYDVRKAPVKIGTSGNAQVYDILNHDKLKKVQHSPSTSHKIGTERSQHVGEYIKFTYKSGNVDVFGSKKVYVINPETFKGTASKSTFYNQNGQRLVYVDGQYQVVN